MYGENIRKLRKEKGVSQSDLAKKSGIPQTVISSYERNAADIPAHRLISIAKALKASIYELTGYAEPINPAELQNKLREADIDQLTEALREKLKEHPDKASLERGLRFLRLLAGGEDLAPWQIDAIKAILGGGNKKEEV